MDIEWVRNLCLSFPQVTEEEVWTNDLTFKVAGKMFAHTVLIPAPVWISFKASPEAFADLTERPNIIPAPYLARAKWVALETKDALPPEELAQLLRQSYDMVVAKLPRKTQESLLAARCSTPKASSKKRAAKKSAAKSRAKTKKPSR
ncbi:MAG TPA: MmcQ/YjbR family DNA-binding protein [Candidatus Acidoferrum sp.]|nr:MmcQ/YjbR family DNA-binding protein [Candidatus Acidoferrum sp.]